MRGVPPLGAQGWRPGESSVHVHTRRSTHLAPPRPATSRSPAQAEALVLLDQSPPALTVQLFPRPGFMCPAPEHVSVVYTGCHSLHSNQWTFQKVRAAHAAARVPRMHPPPIRFHPWRQRPDRPGVRPP